MNDLVKTKLEQIETLYPKERLARSKERWTRLWRGEPPLDRYPFHYRPFGLDYYTAGKTPEVWLHAHLDEIIARGFGNDDFIPAFFPGCHQGTIPSMFGAREAVRGDDYSCDRLIESPSDIDHLPEPTMGSGTLAGFWLAMQRYVLEETEGRLPVHVTDMQGPADVCGQLMGYDRFLPLAYEDHDRYERLMTAVTDAFIAFWDAQHRLCGDLFVGTHLWGWNWVPPDAGAALSADSLVMVSPRFYKLHYDPYIRRIGERFGGAAVHSCGDFSAVIPSLCATPTVKAINAAQMSVESLVELGVDRSTLIIAGVAREKLHDLLVLIREHGLRVDMSIDAIWKPVAEWTCEDRELFRRNEEYVLGLVSDIV
jgi:hypothetical protein